MSRLTAVLAVLVLVGCDSTTEPDQLNVAGTYRAAHRHGT